MISGSRADSPACKHMQTTCSQRQGLRVQSRHAGADGPGVPHVHSCASGGSVSSRALGFSHLRGCPCRVSVGEEPMCRALSWSRLLLWGCESGHKGVLPSAGRGHRARSSPGAWVGGQTQGGCCSDGVSVGGLGDGDWKAPKSFSWWHGPGVPVRCILRVWPVSAQEGSSWRVELVHREHVPGPVPGLAVGARPRQAPVQHVTGAPVPSAATAEALPVWRLRSLQPRSPLSRSRPPQPA